MKKKEERILTVDTFKPRWYQIPIINAVERDGFKKLVIVLSRRAGKDVCALNILLRMAFKRVGCYYYIYPSKDQCRKAVWNSILNDGRRFLDFIPKGLIKGMNQTEMRIDLVNGSIIYFTGTNRMDGMRSTNPVGVVFSEYAYAVFPRAYEAVIRPIHANNGGWTMFVSTPNGPNQFHKIYKKSLERDNWFSYLMTVYETEHMSKEALEEERLDMPPDLFNREYMCSFDTADTGSYYSKYINLAYKENRITNVLHDPTHLVYTCWDLGWSDLNVILFFQVIGSKILIINTYKNNRESIADCVKMLHEYKEANGYIYGQHFVPFDADNHDQGTGSTRVEIAAKLGVTFQALKKFRFMEGINLVYVTFSRIWIDEDKCADFIDSIRMYSRKWDKVNNIWLDAEKKDDTNHDADALRYLCLALNEIDTDYLSPEQVDQRRRSFTHDNRNYHGF